MHGLPSGWLDSRDAGGATRPGPFTSALKERGGGKKPCVLVFSTLWIKKKETEALTASRLHPGILTNLLKPGE